MDASTETAPDPPARADVESGRRRRGAPGWMAALLLVAILAGAGYGGWLLVQRHQTDVAAAQALQAAEKYMAVLLNFNFDSDSGTIDKNMNYLLDGATGEFKDMYARSKSQLLQEQAEHRASARGSVADSVVKTATKNKTVVVLFVDQAVTHRDSADPEMDRSRIRMTMEKVDGRWLVSKMELR